MKNRKIDTAATPLDAGAASGDKLAAKRASEKFSTPQFDIDRAGTTFAVIAWACLLLGVMWQPL